MTGAAFLREEPWYGTWDTGREPGEASRRRVDGEGRFRCSDG